MIVYLFYTYKFYYLQVTVQHRNLKGCLIYYKFFVSNINLLIFTKKKYRKYLSSIYKLTHQQEGIIFKRKCIINMVIAS